MPKHTNDDADTWYCYERPTGKTQRPQADPKPSEPKRQTEMDGFGRGTESPLYLFDDTNGRENHSAPNSADIDSFGGLLTGGGRNKPTRNPDSGRFAPSPTDPVGFEMERDESGRYSGRKDQDDDSGGLWGFLR